ncbi:MAG: hypothetical protein IT211_02285 [Armatimonadetes bacterium]|nr:hypothetical protein [Armatimonadota bacterium]
MTAQEFHNQITAWVEDHPDGNQPNPTEAPCDDCKTTFERELAARMNVSERAAQPISEPRQLGGINAPPEAAPTAQNVVRDAAALATANADRTPSSRFGAWGMLAGAGLALAGAILLLNRPEQPSTTLPIQSPARASAPSGKPVPALNLFNAANSNVAALISGQVKPEMETDSKEELSEFFKERGVRYAVKFPTTQLALAGGFVSNHGNVAVAHLVYRSGQQTMYVLQLPWQLLQQGKQFYVTQDAAQKLAAGETLMESSGSGQSLSIGKYGDLAIAIAANVPQEKIAQLARW